MKILETLCENMIYFILNTVYSHTEQYNKYYTLLTHTHDKFAKHHSSLTFVIYHYI